MRSSLSAKSDMALLRRSESATKRMMKEKVVQIYERFFQGEDLTGENQIFWEELFLLKPNVTQLQAEILKLNEDQIVELESSFNKFFSKCVETLNHPHHIRVLYALQTLCTLISSMYKKSNGKCGFDVINILIGFSVAEKRIHQLLEHCTDFLTGEWPHSLKSICLKLLLIIATGTDNVSQNTLLEYLMIDNIFETLIKLLSDAKSRSKWGHDVILLLTLLVNYRKHETSNPYVVKLSLLDDELSLNGYGLHKETVSGSFIQYTNIPHLKKYWSLLILNTIFTEVCWYVERCTTAIFPYVCCIIAHSLSSFCRSFIQHHHLEYQSTKWITSLTHIVGNMFSTEENSVHPKEIRMNSGVLLALYEVIHLNRNFITKLALTQQIAQESTETRNEINKDGKIQRMENSSHETPLTDVTISKPSNLLITVLQYCSIVMQDIRSEESSDNVKLCFLILTCITEDQYANSIMHDFQLVYSVQLFRMPMRHRQPIQEKKLQPVSVMLLGLLCEFMMSHMMKKLRTELYQLCIGIVHRLICYEKKSNVRITFNWKELWEVLIMLLKFLVANEIHFSKKVVIFNLALQIINIFNLFITYGDTFLASPRSYDLLYYELIRMHVVFENMYSLAVKYSSSEGDVKDVCNKIIASLINIRAIINHFTPKIEKWIEERSSSPTEDEILEILRKNYDSLTLKLLDSLDQFERFSEKPHHSSFFTSLIRNIIIDAKPSIDYVNLDLQTVLREFSSIP